MKKGKRLLIAGLLGIAVTGASTLAYFTSTATVTANDGQAPLALNITNGKVEVTAGIGDGATTPTWSYDVARLSTSVETYGLYSVTDEADTKYVENYIDKNRSMDIIGFDTTVDEGGRRKIGAKLTGAITNARPGDAIVLGDATGADEGIKIENKSTLTVKVRVLAKTDQTTIDTINYLASAGWVMYVNGVATPITTPEQLQTALDLAVITLAPGAKSNNPIKVRLELPLLTDNTLQGDSVGADGTVAASFDISTLFTIMATQENNPGWNESGE